MHTPMTPESAMYMRDQSSSNMRQDYINVVNELNLRLLNQEKKFKEYLEISKNTMIEANQKWMNVLKELL